MQDRRQAVYILIILSLLTGLFTGRASFFSFAYMLVGVFLVSLFWSWTAVRWLNLNRRTRSIRAQVGQRLEETFKVRNTSLLPKLWLEVHDHSSLPRHRSSEVVPALRPRTTYQWTVKTQCLSRGEFWLGPMTLTSGDPFGLFQFQREIAAQSRIIVYPAIVPLNRVALPIGALSGGEAQRRRTHYITTNASGVRDYAPGDSFNRIHWRSTARKNRLIVKEFEIDPLVDIWLFADFSRDSLVESPLIERVNGTGPIIPRGGHKGIPLSTEEHIAVITASLARYFINIERAVGFAAYTPNREVYQPERGNRQLTHMLEALAVARSLSTYSLGQMLTLETPYFTRGTTLIVVTASIESQWVTEAQILSRKGIRVVCVFVDPQTFDSSKLSEKVLGILRLAHISTAVVRYGDDIGEVLAQRPL